MWKHFLHEYLSFTKKERTGIFILLTLILLCIIVPFLYPIFQAEENFYHSKFDKEISELKLLQADSAAGKKYPDSYRGKNFDENNYANYYEPSEKNYYNRPKGELFNFDPNTASANDWKRLGIRDKTAETIQKYLSKGGHFYRPEDISKIWGLHKDDVERLLPYVKIENSKKEYADNKTEFNRYTSPDSYRNKKSSSQVIDINAGDTSAFISLPGIGSKLAQRIISFRDKLGGFYSVDQVKETYGLPDSTFQIIRSKLVLNNTSVKTININTATLEEMKLHPYIRFNIANAIFQYRNQHG
ncbi:MAG TPA: helix-hairpin-helix domain-containing protein, partial [Chitinophagaceae bacterium]|nr:helix-hairpin-helix domain-containing protein [Chitinophagaceae bacterium]